jgi:hypothetical protein
MPSISKECFGGFEELQGLAIAPNPFFTPPNFCGSFELSSFALQADGPAIEATFGSSIDRRLS